MREAVFSTAALVLVHELTDGSAFVDAAPHHPFGALQSPPSGAVGGGGALMSSMAALSLSPPPAAVASSNVAAAAAAGGTSPLSLSCEPLACAVVAEASA